jgi:4-amino-4-deoxy-L-arabinose transferase-like glycosyltransferase
MDRRGSRIAAALLLAALVIRVAVVLATPDQTLIHDAIDYDLHAASIAAGDGFALSYGRPTAFRPPAYPIFLAGVYAVFGHDIQAARVANAFVGTGIVALIGLIAFQLWGRRVCLVALGVGAIYVPLILVGQSVMSEPLFVMFMLGSIAVVLRGRS